MISIYIARRAYMCFQRCQSWRYSGVKMSLPAAYNILLGRTNNLTKYQIAKGKYNHDDLSRQRFQGVVVSVNTVTEILSIVWPLRTRNPAMRPD